MFAPVRFLMTAVGLVLIGLTVAACGFADQIALYGRARLEERLALIYDTQVDIERVHFSPLELAIVAEKVTLFNPEGFEPGPAVQLDRVLLRPDLRTLFSDRVTLNEIVLDNLEVNQKGLGKNVNQLAENARTAKACGVGEDVRVERVRCTGGKVKGFFPVNLRSFESESKSIEDVAMDGGDVRREILKNIGLDFVTLRGLIPVAEGG